VALRFDQIAMIVWWPHRADTGRYLPCADAARGRDLVEPLRGGRNGAAAAFEVGRYARYLPDSTPCGQPRCGRRNATFSNSRH